MISHILDCESVCEQDGGPGEGCANSIGRCEGNELFWAQHPLVARTGRGISAHLQANEPGGVQNSQRAISLLVLAHISSQEPTFNCSRVFKSMNV